MKHIFLKTIILPLSLLAIVCKGEKQKRDFSTLDKPSVKSHSYNRSNDTNTSKGKKNADQENTSEIKQGLEIPIGKATVPSLILYRESYTTLYNAETRTPNWVAWHLTATHTDGPIKCKGIAFQADEEIPAPRVDTYDYVRPGYDRGRMCPTGDNHWSQETMEQSFLMTNIYPQEPALNSGLWNTVEKLRRTWAERYGDVYIVCGPAYFNRKHKTIGKDKVQVPEAFFKVVLRLKDEPKAIGFICRNVSAKGHKKTDYVNTVDEVERIIGIGLFSQLLDNIKQVIES